MAYALRLFACAGCGGPVWKRASQWAKPRCITCAIERSTMNALQLRAKQGAFYDAWAAGILRAAQAAEAKAKANKVIEKAG